MGEACFLIVLEKNASLKHPLLKAIRPLGGGDPARRAGEGDLAAPNAL